MEQQEYLNRIHSEILTVMDEVHRICIENNLKYYLIGGTLLGAIRHKGFIPWDDDLDIVMPRDDFNKFKELTKRPTGIFKLLYGEGYKHYPQYFMKYENTETVFYEGMKWETTKMPGIFVDIFPLEYSDGNIDTLNFKKRAVCRLTDIISKKGGIPKPKQTFIESVLYSFIPMPILHYARRKMAASVLREPATHYANFGSQYSIIKQNFPIEIFGDGQLVTFEDREYYAPVDPVYVLNSIFGENYMQIPPIEKRRTHYPKIVQFSNKERVEFKEPEHKLTIHDQ